MKFLPVHLGLPVRIIRQSMAILCVMALAAGDTTLFASQAPAQGSPAEEQKTSISPEQLDSLVAPIALYPDPLLSQTLVASTYPLEIIQLQQWLGKNKNLKDQALADAVKKQDWDPSIQAMAALPDVVKQLAENITWTTDLGNAFLAQQSDVMDAVQRMRKKAQDGGNLKSSEQQKVEAKVVESKQVIVIEQANPEVVYVPSYNPTVVYGAAAYPYPPIAYPPPGYYAAGMAISFGVGIAMGAAWGGGWGYNSGWGGNNNVYINNNNNFVRNSNTNVNRNQNVNRTTNRTANGNSNWQHNPQHRGGAPYSDRTTANRYGGTAGGDSLSTRQDKARQNQSQRGGVQQASERGSLGSGQPSTRDRSASGNRQPSSSNSAGGRDSGTRTAGGGASNTSANRGGDSVGNRSTSGGGNSRSSNAFGGGAGGSSGSSARASGARGSSSMRSGGGGGRSGGGGRRR
jgi:Protein of unknown function (DUF3300)